MQLAACALFGLLGVTAAARTQTAELSDTRSGMSCAYYDGGAKLAWARKGGDWRDADDAEHGLRPYAAQTIGHGDQHQRVEWDVTALARRWAGGAAPPGGLFLRALRGDRASARFLSREVKQAQDRPRLSIEWSDGTRSEMAPQADATMTCSSASGKGTGLTLHVGYGRAAALVFPFQPRAGAAVREARLTLISDQQFGAAVEVGVFRLHAPSAERPPARSGIAAAYTLDQGIESHPSVVFSSNFESAQWRSDWSHLGSSSTVQRVARDEGNRFAALAGHALQVTVPKGKKMGVNLDYRFKAKTGSEPEAMYMRYYLRLGENWVPSAEGKLPGFAGTYGKAGWGGRQADGEDGWSARGRYFMSPALEDGEYAMGSYVYHAAMTKRYGDAWGWNVGSIGVLRRNRWYSVEQYLKLNTPGQSDGELRAWIDGVPAFERTNLRFRDTRELRIETVWMNVYHGGTARARQDLSLYFDNVVVATEYIGPATGAPK